MVQEKPLKPLCKARLFLLINQASSALWALLCPRRSRAQPLPGCSQARVTLPYPFCSCSFTSQSAPPPPELGMRLCSGGGLGISQEPTVCTFQLLEVKSGAGSGATRCPGPSSSPHLTGTSHPFG